MSFKRYWFHLYYLRLEIIRHVSVNLNQKFNIQTRISWKTKPKKYNNNLVWTDKLYDIWFASKSIIILMIWKVLENKFLE